MLLLLYLSGWSWDGRPASLSDTVGPNLPTDTDPNLPVRVHWVGEARASLLPAQRPWPVWWRDWLVHSVSSSQHHWGLGSDPAHLLRQDGNADREQDGVPALYHHGPRVFSPRKWYGGLLGPHPSYKEITPALLREWWLKPILLARGKGWEALWEVASHIPAAFLSQISAVLITCKLYLLLKAMGNLLCGSPPAGWSLSSVDLCLAQLTQRIFICQECTGEMSKLCSSPATKV